MCPLSVKAGSAIRSCLWQRNATKDAAFIPHAKHDSTIITSEASNHTSTETKAEQLDGIVIRHAAHTALAMTTNDYCTIEANRCNNTLYTRSKPMDHFIFFLHSSYANKT
jgi:hypothetical protein